MKEFLSRISSRKFLFWVTATVLLLLSRISSKEWILCSVIFIGGKVLEILFDLLKLKWSGKGEE